MAEAARASSRPPTYDELYVENARLRSRIAELERSVAFAGQAGGFGVSELPAAPASASAEAAAGTAREGRASSTSSVESVAAAAAGTLYTPGHSLTHEQILRYGRHLILPEVGVARQARWCKGSVLVVGAGGLGAPVLLYLAAAGVGRITVIDDDVVDLSNLQRQVIHSERTIGRPKVESARAACLALNSSISVTAVHARLDEGNALALAEAHDVIIDASDNVSTRYLLSDVGVVAGKPVVSGSALRTEGQLTVYAYGAGRTARGNNTGGDSKQDGGGQGCDKAVESGPAQGPCYRCLFPAPPPPATVTNCSDGGVLGVIPGVIGCLQAHQALQLLAGEPAEDTLARKLLLVDGSASRVRTVSLRARSPQCAACGDSPTVTRETVTALGSYAAFCGGYCSSTDADPASTVSAAAAQSAAAGGGGAATSLVAAVRHITAAEFGRLYWRRGSEEGERPAAGEAGAGEGAGTRIELNPPSTSTSTSASSAEAVSTPSLFPRAAVLLDVREAAQFAVCALPGAINVPLRALRDRVHEVRAAAAAAAASGGGGSGGGEGGGPPGRVPVVVMCRRGLDSVVATRILAELETLGTDAGTATGAGAAAAGTGSHAPAPLPLPLPLPRLDPVNLVGGLQAFRTQVDPNFPVY